MVIHKEVVANVNTLARLFLGVSKINDMENLLEGLLTKREIEKLLFRLKIIKMLKEGIPQREIAERLGVGIATVTRGSKEISIGRFKTL